MCSHKPNTPRACSDVSTIYLLVIVAQRPTIFTLDGLWKNKKAIVSFERIEVSDVELTCLKTL